MTKERANSASIPSVFYIFNFIKNFPLITIQPFDTTQDGRSVSLVILKNPSGMEAHFITYGAILQRLIVPDAGDYTDVVLGYNDLITYENDTYFLGQLIGRNANRIAHAEVVLDGKKVALSANEGTNQLHGGFEGFGKKIWNVAELDDEVVFSYMSKDGEEGFPGNLLTKMFVKLTDANELVMRLEATTDQETIVNLTRHEYFNLNPNSGKGIAEHTLQINGGGILPKNENNVPTGEVLQIEGTPFDLQKSKALAGSLSKLDGGFDHNYVLEKYSDEVPAAILVAPGGSPKLEVHCTQPGLQFYSAAGIGAVPNKYGAIQGPSPALCLEPQYFPDSPNHPNFPSTVLRPDAVYRHEIRYKFL